jgi:AcrR family transcriptional regulator
MPSIRDAQADAVRERIVGAALAVIASGREPTMRSVAAAAGISERTIYRYYASLDALREAFLPELRKRASARLPDTAAELLDYARALFTTFDANQALVRALVRSPWSGKYTSHTRPRNLGQLQALIDEGFPDAPADTRRSAAAGLRVPLSGAGWVYLDDCGLSSDERIAHVQWLIRTVFEKLSASASTSGGSHA